MVNIMLIVAAYFPVRYFYDGQNPAAAAAGTVIVVGLLMAKFFLDGDRR